ncbi:MAG: transporter, permease protein, partial [Myxococcaceae bacterium]|nr:transporter, permease protein [Myxococcaceae bacterium]
YRAEMFVWVLATTMPFIMLALWSAVAAAAPVVSHSGRSYSTGMFTAYFLAVFIVRQLISSWASWEINWEVRQGTLAMRLLRPIHPIVSYAASNLAALPMRSVVTLPVVVIIFVVGVQGAFPSDPGVWGLWAVAMLGGWLITFFANVAIGSLSLYMESSIKVMDIWLAGFFVFSGYLYPLDMFPGFVRAAADWLPFRYQIGVPVELMTGAHGFDAALQLVIRQWMWAAGLGVVAVLLWNNGVKRFQAFGG